MSAPEKDPHPVLPWRGETTRHHAGWPRGYWQKVVWRGLRLRCPVCGQGKLFRTYFRMYDTCTVCGVGLAPEHGPWVGERDNNTFVVGVRQIIAWGRAPAWPLPVTLIVWGAAAIVIPLVTFRFSRGLWTAIVHLTGGVH